MKKKYFSNFQTLLTSGSDNKIKNPKRIFFFSFRYNNFPRRYSILYGSHSRYSPRFSDYPEYYLTLRTHHSEEPDLSDELIDY